MCEQCAAATIGWRLLPGVDGEFPWILVKARRDGMDMKKGQWGLLQVNDPDIIFTTAPVGDPTPEGLTDEQINEYYRENADRQNELNVYLDTVDNIENQCLTTPEVGYSLVKAAMAAGYDEEVNGHRIMSWLVERMAKLIEEKPNGDPELESGWPAYVEEA